MALVGVVVQHPGLWSCVGLGDLVLAGKPRGAGTPGLALADYFRLPKNGKVVEHWDVIQSVPTTSANPNSM